MRLQHFPPSPSSPLLMLSHPRPYHLYAHVVHSRHHLSLRARSALLTCSRHHLSLRLCSALPTCSRHHLALCLCGALPTSSQHCLPYLHSWSALPTPLILMLV
ncbi:hypothetical protein O181_118155 [Austropuccinia psidii MF-1]|uniref:Uncharacterized protein n=1 Tax=Austropuccinia psidii MF-1 TaxID=1389203 RepID=A0A9Q3KFT9_9BASI|nr:hypothetical protein [Austropuccinia psidii MF-1]